MPKLNNVTQKQLWSRTSSAEYWLGEHAQSAAEARAYARRRHFRAAARFHGQRARAHLARYLDAKQREAA